MAAYYFLISRSLNSRQRIRTMLRVWCVSIVVLSIFGIGVLHGFDITAAKDLMEPMKGRLVLGTWIHNNPNALGHTLITGIPLLYFCLVFRRGILPRLLFLPSLALVLYPLYETKSKGAFVVGLGLVVLTFFVGRPLWLKITAGTLTAIVGASLISSLPRMTEMNDLRSDEGVIGRLMVWEQARTALQSNWTGHGFKEFAAYISWEGDTIEKATHSSYVRIGADLGYPGLFFFVGGIVLGMRTLTSRRFAPPDFERERRVLMCLLVAYAGSSWMIDRAYHIEYFLTLALVAAHHRLCVGESSYVRRNWSQILANAMTSKPQPEPETAPENSVSLGGLNDQSSPTIDEEIPRPGRLQPVAEAATIALPPQSSLPSPPSQLWSRVGLLDIGIGLVATIATLKIWDYILANL